MPQLGTVESSALISKNPAMKTPGYIAVYLLLCCLACTQSSLVDQSDLLSPEQRDGVIHASPIDLSSASYDSCMAFETTYWLNASGTYLVGETPAAEDRAGINALTGTYVIEANGDGISDIFARGQAEMQLILHEGTHSLYLRMTTQFYYGEVMEVTVDGIAETGSGDGSSTQLRIAIDSAVLRSKEHNYVIDNGQITLNLPATPEGDFCLHASAIMWLCVQ